MKTLLIEAPFQLGLSGILMVQMRSELTEINERFDGAAQWIAVRRQCDEET